jgi:hypothetical protein
VNDSSMDSAALGEDTVDLQLTPEQMLELSQAAETAAAEDKPPSRIRHWHQSLIAKLAAGTIAVAALAWWCGSQLAGHPPPLVAAVVASVPRPVLVADAATQAVRIVNPFDATEVFEFPAGTSAADSREQVAQILLNRARERQSRWERMRPRVAIRTASVYHSPQSYVRYRTDAVGGN